MKYYSTRNKKNGKILDKALVEGLASDGGLFMPEIIPTLDYLDFFGLSYSEMSAKVLKPFFKGSSLLPKLDQICEKSFDFDVCTSRINKERLLLELYHGPTLSFKDFGARFLSNCLSELRVPLHILVATSGDTGGAVASAFYNKKNMEVSILYPKDGVSEGQRSQLNYLHKNIRPIAVDGSFDDCQKLVKDAFNDSNFKNLTSANSINIGRLLGQITYYVYTSVNYFQENHKKVSFSIPSGNVGNATACVMAKIMGFPIDSINLASNENKAINHFMKTGDLVKFQTINTVANAMDVGLPSNLERLKTILEEHNIKNSITTSQVMEKNILKCMKSFFFKYKKIIDPHTAVAWMSVVQSTFDTIVVSTAHPSKFPRALDFLDIKCKIPKTLKVCLNTKYKELEIKPNLKDLKILLKYTKDNI